MILYYVDLSHPAQQEETEEDYLNIVKQQITNSINKDYIFADGFESAIIAGEEYTVMRTSFTFKEDPPKTPGYQDSYVRRLDNAFIVMLTVYEAEMKDSVDSFLSSISPMK